MMADKIEIDISADPVTGFRRVGRHQAFVIDQDLEMIQQIMVIPLNKKGKSIAEEIASDPKLSATQKQQRLARNDNYVVTRQTRGTLVHPATGAVVEEGTEGAVLQSQFFQELTIGHLKAMGMEVTDGTKFLQLLYQFLAGEIGTIDKRGDL